MENLDIFEPMQHPGHLVRRLHQICVAVFLDVASPHNITHIQFAALKAIEKFPNIDQITLAKIVALDRQTTSNLVIRLHERGLIERKRKYKRSNSLTITNTGIDLINSMQPKIKIVDETVLQPLTNKERKDLIILLKKLVDQNNDLSRAPYEPSALKSKNIL